jgi:branched-chain amino acid transport system ATP-binding protein
MSTVLLSANQLSVRFGGVLAVKDVSFEVRAGEVFTLIGPNGAGKTTVFNLISRIYNPTSGTIDYAGPQGMLRLTDHPPHAVAALGIARTFQNIELFEFATVLQNLLIGRHTQRRSTLWQDLFFTASVRAVELEARQKAEEVIEFLELQHYRDTLVAGLPYGVRKVVEMARALCAQPRLILAIFLKNSDCQNGWLCFYQSAVCHKMRIYRCRCCSLCLSSRGRAGRHPYPPLFGRNENRFFDRPNQPC